jgi:aryl-alcohol dehydrogenase-like predicted oxidoreductase
MKMHKPARFGEEISAIGFGSWGISGAWGEQDEPAYIRTIRAAIDHGITFLDTAPVYGLGVSEQIIGKALEGIRDKVFLASKCGLSWSGKRVSHDLSPVSLKAEIEASLKRLNCDYIDLWQVHWPSDDYSLDDALEAIGQVRSSGKVRFLGLSNFSAKDLEYAHRAIGIDSYQGLFNMFEQNAPEYHGIDLRYRVKSEILPLVKREGMAFLPYSPLMQGMLAGGIGADSVFAKKDVRRANPRLTPENRKDYLDILEKLRPIAADRGISLAQLALLWTINVEGVGSVIAGARSVEHVVKNAEAADIPDQKSIISEVEAVLDGYRELVE